MTYVDSFLNLARDVMLVLQSDWQKSYVMRDAKVMRDVSSLALLVALHLPPVVRYVSISCLNKHSQKLKGSRLPGHPLLCLACDLPYTKLLLGDQFVDVATDVFSFMKSIFIAY